MSRAPKEVIEEQNNRKEILKNRLSRVESAINKLK